MKKYRLASLTTLVIPILLSCGESQHSSSKKNNLDTNSTQASTTDVVRQKITPSFWVDKDAKAVVDYYLAIFKDGKMKEYHQ